MTKEEKIQVVAELSEKLKETPNIYVTDADGMDVSQISALRRQCFDAGIELKVVKNTLLKIALDQAEGDYSELYGALKRPSSVFFVKENINAPAKLIQKFRKAQKLEKPEIKGAYIDESVYLGDDSLGILVDLKSKNELIGEIIGLLQSPAKNVVSALKSGGGKILGILETLSNKEEG